MKVGEIFKRKIGGRKQKVQILGPNDVIQPGDLCTKPLLCDNPMCYSKTLAAFEEIKNTVEFFYSHSIGETVSDWHTARIYIRPVNF